MIDGNAKHSPTNDWDTNAVWVDARRVRDPAEQAPLVARSVTPPSPSGRGGTTLLRQRAPRSCTVFVMTPPNEHTSEGGRDDRGVPYHAESTLSSAQVLKSDATEEEATRERTTRVGRPRGGMKVAARIGEALRREIGRKRQTPKEHLEHLECSYQPHI